ncbi:MAG: MerR family transcriptional regulator [Acidovorax sp.]|nr:MerR family transcriptional regulator [Acidovorax sp.]
MSAYPTTLPAELLDDDRAALTLEALARACCMDADWVTARLQEGLLHVSATDSDDPTAWRFSGATVVRARRIAHLEVTFDADPHLAALTADLIEEVTTLRQQLRHLKSR